MFNRHHLLPIITEMFGKLPHDMLELIVHHLSASMIQKQVRIFFYRFANTQYWKKLRHHLLTTLSIETYSLLQKQHYVRKEWRQEPSSWIDNQNIDIILEETKLGLWS